MDLMHHEDRMLGSIGAAVFLALVAGALFISLNRDPAQQLGALDGVLAPPITQPLGF